MKVGQMVDETAVGGTVMRRARPRGLGWLAAGTLLVAVAMSALAGCDMLGVGGNGSTATTVPIPAVTATAKEFSFDMPSSLSSPGLHAITLNNAGTQPHQLNIARLNDGVTEDQVSNAFKSNPDSALAMVTFVGGPNTVDPGKSQTVTLDMPPGTYVAVCFLNDVKDPAKTHVEEGMYKYFTVPQSASSAGAAPSEPTDDGLVTLSDFHIALPSAGPFHAGVTTWKVWNHGGQPHEMNLLKLAQGETEQDAISYLEEQNPSGPPPFTDAGGMGGLGVDKSGWVTLNLDAGNYVALCFVPDPATGKPHFMLGMETPFTVQ